MCQYVQKYWTSNKCGKREVARVSNIFFWEGKGEWHTLEIFDSQEGILLPALYKTYEKLIRL